MIEFACSYSFSVPSEPVHTHSSVPLQKKPKLYPNQTKG